MGQSSGLNRRFVTVTAVAALASHVAFAQTNSTYLLIPSHAVSPGSPTTTIGVWATWTDPTGSPFLFNRGDFDLTADDDDGNILNGTPNCLLILDAFNKHGISNEVIPCGESALHGSPGCYADLNVSTGEGVLDVFDFLSFQELFLDGNPLACDCDTSTLSGVCDVFDFLCFQAAFAAGCNREQLDEVP